MNQNHANSLIGNDEAFAFSQPERTKSTRRKIELSTIDGTLARILKYIQNGQSLVFEHKAKSNRGLYHGLSRRRSQYIGVLRNRGKWQVLINEGRSKKYIGTYATEIEAAVMHDFYSIGINGIKAKTNFTYKNDMIAEMIGSYFSSNKTFIPSLFVSRINTF